MSSTMWVNEEENQFLSEKFFNSRSSKLIKWRGRRKWQNKNVQTIPIDCDEFVQFIRKPRGSN